MGSLSFEPSDKDIEFVEALLKGINEYSKKLSATQNQEELSMNNKNKLEETKLYSASVYGDTVMKIVIGERCLKDKCRHFDPVKLKCDKTHHCDCDCPDCSPESYATKSDFVE